MPPLVILMALLIIKAYEIIKTCNKCQITRFLAEVIFITFTLSGIVSVLIAPDPSTPTVKALRWMRENTLAESSVYTYKQWFLPQTILFHPKKVELVDQDGLNQLLANEGGVYLFVADMHEDEVLDVYPELEVEKVFKMGSIYSLQ
jgi:hypothetical protein